ncbi:MAG: 30S ribosomal protein S15 [Candidatus Dadabacteria bacterium]|nr:30S ribosomal protein S15 [Candidatus Dadabacteria bacterium]NIQ16366.1 30S ribosomal protein S15 [Candidatus Dadabacteria bacterium]
MALDREDKAKVINEFRKHEKDVGSPEVQIGILSKRIEDLSAHMEKAPKDNHSRRGLVLLVAKRRRLLNYVKRVRPSEYGELISRLGLRR